MTESELAQERDLDPVNKFVDEQWSPTRERRNHGPGGDLVGLNDKGADQDGDQNGDDDDFNHYPGFWTGGFAGFSRRLSRVVFGLDFFHGGTLLGIDVGQRDKDHDKRQETFSGAKTVRARNARAGTDGGERAWTAGAVPQAANRESAQKKADPNSGPQKGRQTTTPSRARGDAARKRRLPASAQDEMNPPRTSRLGQDGGKKQKQHHFPADLGKARDECVDQNVEKDDDRAGQSEQAQVNTGKQNQDENNKSRRGEGRQFISSSSLWKYERFRRQARWGLR